MGCTWTATNTDGAAMEWLNWWRAYFGFKASNIGKVVWKAMLFCVHCYLFALVANTWLKMCRTTLENIL